jgi:hypothetical protein
VSQLSRKNACFQFPYGNLGTCWGKSLCEKQFLGESPNSKKASINSAAFHKQRQQQQLANRAKGEKHEK